MIAKNILNRAELSFWDVTIPLMTRSALVRRCFRGIYSATHSGKFTWIPAMIVTWAGFGLLAGFVLGRMGASLW